MSLLTPSPSQMKLKGHTDKVTAAKYCEKCTKVVSEQLIGVAMTASFAAGPTSVSKCSVMFQCLFPYR